MINEILSIFDKSLTNKCWIDTYARIAIAGKQKMTSGKWSRFPIATEVIISECDDFTQYLNTLSPDDRKTSVAFWKQLSQIKYSKVPGLASNRRIRKAEVSLQFVCWLNVRKASGVNNSTNWDSVMNSIVKDAINTIECRNPITPTDITGVSNLTIDIVGIGNIETWRKAMSEYTIENIEAVSVWPFSGFTLDCKLSFLTREECFEAFTCSSEFDATGFCQPVQ